MFQLIVLIDTLHNANVFSELNSFQLNLNQKFAYMWILFDQLQINCDELY